jgi:Spy/CpxP family protein refolding chaperone
MKSLLSRNLNTVLAPILALMVGALLSFSALAQSVDVQAKPLADADIQLLRQDIQAKKNQLITDNMSFTEAEAAAFWPVYKEYAAAQHAIADKRLAVITDYARSYDKMDDATANALTQRFFAIEDETQALRKEYFPRFAKALVAKRAAQFYQVDNRITLMINLQLAANLPLIP